MKAKYRRALLTLLLVILGIAATTLSLRIALGTPNPFYTVVSGSMIPTLNIGDIVIVKDSNTFNEVKEGDIIVFRSPLEQDKVIVHRVIRVLVDGGEKMLITKGDNNFSPDPWRIGKDQYVGKVIYSIPYLGILAAIFRPPINYILIGIILIFLFLSEVRKK